MGPAGEGRPLSQWTDRPGAARGRAQRTLLYPSEPLQGETTLAAFTPKKPSVPEEVDMLTPRGHRSARACITISRCVSRSGIISHVLGHENRKQANGAGEEVQSYGIR